MGSMELCKSCSRKSQTGEKNSFFGKKHSKKTLSRIKQTKSKRDYTDVVQSMAEAKKQRYALSQGYASAEELEKAVISYLESKQCGAANKKMLKALNVGKQAVKNILTRTNRLDLLQESPEFKAGRLAADGLAQKEAFAKECGYPDRATMEKDVVAFMEKTGFCPYSEPVQSQFPNLSLTTIAKILIAHGKKDLFNTGDSSYEQDVCAFLDSLGIAYVKNTRSEINPYELDVYLTEKKIAIEMNGLYWHSELFKDPDYHFKKRQLCEEKGISLLQINSDEWLGKKDIVKSIILAKLGIFEHRIPARKCTVSAISKKEAERFCEENHLMGSSQGVKNLGLYHEGVLVSVLTYKAVPPGIDIARFCTLKNYQVMGGLGKLLSHLKKTESPEFIQSFVDLRYGNGRSLEALNFKCAKITQGWKWTDFIQTYNRLRCTKKNEEAKLGWVKIYDAGQAKWLLSS